MDHAGDGEAGAAAALEKGAGIRPRVPAARAQDAAVRLLAHRARLVAVLAAEGADAGLLSCPDPTLAQAAGCAQCASQQLRYLPSAGIVSFCIASSMRGRKGPRASAGSNSTAGGRDRRGQ